MLNRKNKNAPKRVQINFLYIFGVKPIKYVIMLEDNAREMTLGEKRCHINFNPSSDDKIGTFKRMMADAIDYCNDNSNMSADPEAKRCFEIAMEHLETAQMYGVKGIAKGLK